MAMLVECVENHNSAVSEQVDWRMWAVSGDNNDEKSLVTSGSLSLYLVEKWKKLCAEDPDCGSDVSAEDGRTSKSGLLQMKQVLEGPSGKSFTPFWTPATR